MDKNQFHYQRVTQSDYRGGATRQTKDKKEKIEVDLPVLSLSDAEQKLFISDVESATDHIYEALVGEEGFAESKGKCAARIFSRMGIQS